MEVFKALYMMVLALAVLTSLRATNACTPMPSDLQKGIKMFYREALAVARVHVLSERTIGSGVTATRTYTTRLHRVYKGCVPADGNKVYIATMVSRSACGTSLEIGHTYFIMFPVADDVRVRRGFDPLPGFRILSSSFVSQVAELSVVERRFLRRKARLPYNACR